MKMCQIHGPFLDQLTLISSFMQFPHVHDQTCTWNPCLQGFTVVTLQCNLIILRWHITMFMCMHRPMYSDMMWPRAFYGPPGNIWQPGMGTGASPIWQVH